jgi:hypothetical protein
MHCMRANDSAEGGGICTHTYNETALLERQRTSACVSIRQHTRLSARPAALPLPLVHRQYLYVCTVNPVN